MQFSETMGRVVCGGKLTEAKLAEAKVSQRQSQAPLIKVLTLWASFTARPIRAHRGPSTKARNM